MPKIVSTGIRVPEKLVSNEDLYARFGRETLESVFARIGHGARYHSAPEESSGDHAVRAAEDALAAAEMRPEEIDLLIVATDTPAFLSPATAAFVQHRLGAKNAAAFDVNCACAAFVTAMDIAAKYLGGDAQYKTALVVGTYAMSKFLDPKDANTYPLFGDGAGAVILRKDPGETHLLSSRLTADGSYWDYMGIYGGGSAAVASPEVVAAGTHNVRILKKFPATLNKDQWPPLVRRTLEKGKLEVQDVDLFIFTQIRRFTIEQVMEEFGLPMERTHCIMDKWGYTGSACIPMALHDAIAAGKLRRGQRLVLCASGGGYAMACLAITY
ncbi:MAG: ketoacyl-ACP synthase III [Elusimicrobia bacterium]|nr:ketoacyl-ACP synthase III [Elusimicrobiota bacterium]